MIPCQVFDGPTKYSIVSCFKCLLHEDNDLDKRIYLVVPVCFLFRGLTKTIHNDQPNSQIIFAFSMLLSSSNSLIRLSATLYLVMSSSVSIESNLI